MMGINNKSNAAPKTKQATLSAFFAKKPSPAAAPEAAKTNQAASNALRRLVCGSDSEAEASSEQPAAKKQKTAADIRRFSVLCVCALLLVALTLALHCFRYAKGAAAATTTPRLDSGARDRFLRRFNINSHSDGGPGFDADMDEAGGEDDGEEAVQPRKNSRTPSKSAQKTKYTPLELQYLEIRKKNPGVVLAVEVGYKYRFFEEDALTAAKELNIVAYMDKNLKGASIPVHRLNVHVSKLVQLGYKVGIVRQTETAALKAAGDNKSAPFERKLTNIFTKGTFIDPDLSIADSSENGFENKSSYIMVIWEESLRKGATSSQLSQDGVEISVVAVQLSTGEVIYDSFQDCLTRTELETRLEHLNPVELILPFGDGSLSATTERFLSHWASRSEVKGDVVRIERLKDAFVGVSESRVALTEFFERPLKSRSVSTSRDAHVFSQVLDLPGPVLICLSALLLHLTEFGLEHALLLTKGFTPFSQIGHMVLSGPTLKALEIFETEEAGVIKGSLLWVLDHTITKFGARLLRKWVGRPLVNVALLNERIDAVEEVISSIGSESIPIVKLRGLLHQLPDLEKSLARIHYTRCPPSDLHATLTSLQKIANTFPSAANASKLDEAEMTDARKQVLRLKLELKSCEAEFGEILKGIRKQIRNNALEYVSVSGMEYLVEIKVGNAGAVPKDWIKINGTKAVSRFHTPEILEQLQSRDMIIEELNTAAEIAYSELVAEIAGHYQELKDVVHSLAVADCLMSLAKVASQPGYVKPTYSPEPIMEVKGGRHPMVELLISNFVENDITLTNNDRCLLITGPNMGGKSSYIRQTALLALLGQIGSYVPANSAHLGIFDSIHTRMGAYDDITRGQSTFMKELSETAQILNTATARSLVIIDELGRGTSTHDGTAIAWGTLKDLVERIGCATLFVTHYPVLGGIKCEGDRQVRCGHMGFLATEEAEEEGEKEGTAKT
ncbi:DNA mismatch repair protein msh3, partial [Obelidium mucronatum]